MQTKVTIRTSSTCSTFIGRGFNADASYDGIHLHYLFYVYQKPMQKEQDDHRKMINSVDKGRLGYNHWRCCSTNCRD